MLPRYFFAFFTIIHIVQLTVNSSPDVHIECDGIPSFMFMRMIHLPIVFLVLSNWVVYINFTDE